MQIQHQEDDAEILAQKQEISALNNKVSDI